MNYSLRASIIFLTLSLFSFPVRAETPPKIVTSIAPVYALVSAVTDGVTKPVLLVKGQASPHTYTLTPEDARALAHADIVFFIGYGLEAFLEKPLKNIPSHATKIALMEQKGLQLFPYRHHHIWIDKEDSAHDDDDDNHSHGDHDEHDGDGEEAEHHHHTGNDAHIWLDPDNAVHMVQTIQKELSAIDPDHSTQYQANADILLKNIADTDARIQSKLAPYQDTAYLVFHDGYQYFERHYHMHSIGALTLSPEKPLGAKALSDISTLIRQQHAACLFSEIEFPEKMVQSVASTAHIPSAVLDPLGVTTAPATYTEMLEAIADTMVSCFTQAPAAMEEGSHAE